MHNESPRAADNGKRTTERKYVKLNTVLEQDSHSQTSSSKMLAYYPPALRSQLSTQLQVDDMVTTLLGMVAMERTSVTHWHSQVCDKCHLHIKTTVCNQAVLGAW